MKKFSAIILATLLLTACTNTEPTESDTLSSSTSSSVSENSSVPNSASSLQNSSSTTSGSSSVNPDSSSSESSDPNSGLTPLSFTDEDLELQRILGGLIEDGASEVYSWFYSFTSPSDVCQNIIFSNDEDSFVHSYNPIPHGYGHSTHFTEFPSTYAEMEEIVGSFFTKQAAAEFMKYVSNGTVTGEKDGVLLVTLENNTEEHMPPYYFEAGGVMYHLDIIGAHTLNLDYQTARVTAKSDGRIDFKFLPNIYEYLPTDKFRYEELYYDYAEEGFIALEDGVWKLPHIYV
ncbi:MAG: hypothetical protein J1F03_06395 [Oscillospiraceae bacterium]|nr:hypothetical protein [Oscillospiraceae bacterium]